MVRAVAAAIPRKKIAIHFHDTHGRALANILACFEEDISVVDSAIGGLGGCPYAPGASGNLATEDLVDRLDGLGVKSGVDIEGLMRRSEEHTSELQSLMRISYAVFCLKKKKNKKKDQYIIHIHTSTTEHI